MRRLTTALAIFAIFAFSGAAAAQQATTGEARTDGAVRQELRSLITRDDAASDRAALRDFLDSDAARTAAEANGLDLERARDGVNALSPEQARALADRLVGGDTVVITGTTIVIILLVLILIKI